MITSPARAADRVVGASGPPPRALSASTALLLLLLGGLALRLTIAYILFPASGFPSDVSSYVSWAMTMAHEGPAGFYANAGFSDYPPGYLLVVLWPIGALSDAFGGNDPYSLATALIKIPPMLVDIAVGYVLYRLVLGWAWPGRRAEALALGAAALFVFNPVTFYDSALWGQTDAVGALVILLGVAALVRGNSEGAAFLGTIAALIKPQFGLVLIPLVAVMLLRRHVFRPGSGPRRAPWGPAPLRGWLAREQGWRRIITSAIVALVTFHVVALPFGMGIQQYLQLMGGTAAGYQFLSVNAFNPWALIGSDGDSLAVSAMYHWSDDTIPLLGPLPGVVIGGTLLVVGFLYGLGNALVRDERRTIVATTIFLCLCFFVLPTRVHERYLLPVFALVPLLAVTSRSWLVALAALSVGSFINLHAVLTRYGTDDIKALPLGDFSAGSVSIVLSVALVTGAFLFCGWRLWRGAAREPDGFALAAAEVQGTVDLGPVPAHARSVQRGAPMTAAPASGYAAYETAAGPMPTAPDTWPEATDTGYVRGPSALDWIIDRITSRPLRRDRSASLRTEPAGRLDRLDLFVALCILLSAVTIRGNRLAEPYDMYFDEVYHARTAMEFLQDWRYGDPHNIYEYTHPHLAKYAMAYGIELFGDHRVTGQSQLGGPVLDAVLEPRWSDSDAGDVRVGDRLYVLTGSQLAVYDLAGRTQVAALPTTASALAIDADAHVLYLASPDGSISLLDTTTLDSLRQTGQTDAALMALPTTAPAAGPVRLTVEGETLVVLDRDSTLQARDIETGEVLASTSLEGAADVVSVPSAEAVVVVPADIEDIPGTAEVLAQDMGLDIDSLQAQLESGDTEVVLGAWLGSVASNAVRGHIDDSTLTGVSLDDRSIVAVSTSDGVSFLDAASLSPLTDVGMDSGATGMAWADNAPDTARLYVASGSELRSIEIPTDGPELKSTIDMPGTITDVVWNAPPQLVHAVGVLPDGTPTVYVVDPHGNSVFEDVALPFTPITALADTQPDRPSQDRTQILALASDGATASIDVGGNAWGYRLPGVLMGAATAAFLYLLARLLFRRRSVGLFAAALALAEGMLFANSRIAMNDVYVTGFLVMATTLFVPIWLGSWRRPWQVLLLLPIIGVLLGLALASKWVAAYAIGGFMLLILLRSGLGRLIALAGMIGLTAVLGAMAVRPPPDTPDPHLNWPFVVIMLLLTSALAAAMVRRPLRVTRKEVGSAVIWLVLLGVAGAGLWLAIGSTLPETGTLTARRLLLLVGGSFLGAAVVGIGALVAGRLGRGPFVPRQDGFLEEPAVSDAPGWVSAGTVLGIPWLLAIACLTLVPVVVYVISYAPWVALGNQFWTGFPAGNTGQTLLDLTISMYRYHDELRAQHAASSPWWAWPLDLKPVWYYQQGFADRTTGSIHDTGNLVIFWMGIPAMLFAALAAWRRRSLALTVVVVMFLAMWLTWSRIDRATFQYHYYTSLPFLVLALAYLLAELWHGPARIAWLIARVGAALCVVGAPLMWLLRQPLCIAANTQAVNAGSEACGSVSRNVSLSDQSLAVLLVLVIGGAVLLWQLWRASQSPPATPREQAAAPGGAAGRALAGMSEGPMGGIVVTIGATLIAVVACILVFSDQNLVQLQLGANELALVALIVLAGPAWLVLRARDARRFALGIVVAAWLWLLIWYPNLTGLPMPSGLANIYQGLLPTWNYAFQFATDMDPVTKGGLVDAGTVTIGVVCVIAVVGVMVVAHRWRSHPSSADFADLE